jgi:hypothetical protein
VKTPPVVALAAVREDVQAAHDYFSARSPAGGDKLLERSFATTDRIESNPEAFPLKFDDYRRALIPAAISPSTILSKRIVRSSPP